MNVISECLMKPGTVVSLNGDWGSGKTYSWYNKDKPENTIRGKLEKSGKKTIYISLFGKSNISDLKKEILNKSIEIKGFLFHFLMIFILIFFLTALISVFALQVINSYIVKFIACIVAGITTGIFYSHILRFFAQKTLGFDHNNIDFSTILNSKKIVFCFDDVERLSKNANLEDFMGFFELLACQGFSMLLIHNSNYSTTVHSEIWKEFKEKVVNVSLHLKKDNTLNTILNNSELTDFEKFFINSIYRSLQNAKVNLDKYVESDSSNIQKLANNLRFYKKMIDAFTHVKYATQGYKDLDENTIGNILMYVTVICVHNELEIPLETPPTKDKLYDFLFGTEIIPNKTNKLKHFGAALRFNQWYGLIEFPTIYGLLMYGEFDYVEFSKEHTSALHTDLEKYVLNLGHWLNYRTAEQYQIVGKIEELFCKDSEEFSSLENMRQVLMSYSVFCSYIGKDLTKQAPKCLYNQISKFINNHEISLNILASIAPFRSLIHISSGEDKIFAHNKDFINNIFEKYLLDYWIGKFTQITDIEYIHQNILMGDLSYEKQLFLYVLFNDANKQKIIFDLRDSNYQKWQEMIKLLKLRLKEYNEENDLIKHIRKILHDNRESKRLFVNALISNVKELENISGAGLSEQYVVKDLMSD